MRRTTKGTALIIMPVLAAAWVILYLFPGRTEQLWAWTIHPDMTPITLGAGYLAGAWFFFRVATNSEPYRVVGGLAAAAVFTAFLLAATVLHWDRFNHGHVSFWAWLFLYLVSPPLLVVLAVANHRAALRPEPGDALSGVLRWCLVAVGAGQLMLAVVMFALPRIVLDNAPWALTPLTARTLSAFLAFTGALLLWPLFDRRWGAVQIGVEAVTIGLLLVGAGALRARGDFSGPLAGRVAWVAALVALLTLLGWVQLATIRRLG